MAWDSYEFWLTDDRGARITDELGVSVITKALWCEYSRVKNGIGWLSLVLPNDFDTRLFRPDRMIQVWRAPRGGKLSLFRPYFVRRWRFETRGGVESLTVGGPGPNDLARRRVVPYYDGDPEAEIVAENADDGMKDVADENMVNDTSSPDAGSRDWANLSVQGDASAGPALTDFFAWRRILEVLRNLQKASREAGTETFWDFAVKSVSSTAIDFEFRTKVGQPGQDRTSMGVLFDQQRGNMGDAFLEYDYSEEVNYVYGVGQGQEDDVVVEEVYDADRYNASIWNRCEAVANASGRAEDSDAVREAARAVLEAGRPVRRFGADVIDVDGMRFGVDWDWGDKARARYRGLEFDCVVNATVVAVAPDGTERIAARLEYEGV